MEHQRLGVGPAPSARATAGFDDGLRLLEPDPYTIFQISPQLPVEAQRLRLTVGVPPGTESVTYAMNSEPLGTVDAEPWALWWPLEQGDWELVAQATLADGTVETSDPIPFSVTIYMPPESHTEGTSP